MKNTTDVDPAPVERFVQPHWERGYRCHGYWSPDGERLGMVGIGHIHDGTYGWSVDGKDIEGKSDSLRKAKRQVERHATFGG